MAGALEVRLLGSLDVRLDGHPVELRSARQRALLATLAMSAGEVVSIDRLADTVWADDLPESVRSSLQTYVARLRSALGQESLDTEVRGYRLCCGREQVDALRFADLVAAAAHGDDASRRAMLVEALGLWRGTPFADTGSEQLVVIETPRLTELYLSALEQRIDLDLAAGKAADLVAELHDLTTRFRLRESLWVRLITALDRAGRPAEALAAYEQIRVLLGDELGADPGQDLQRLHARLLSGEQTAGSSVPQQLPTDIAGFTGRSEELAVLDRLIPDGRAAIAVLHGAGGVGKSTLAVHWAHQVGEHFPDGRLFVDLRGYGAGEPAEPGTVLGLMLRALGVPPEQLPSGVEARSALLRTTLDDRRVLIVLDNARDAEQVRPLLPGATSMVLVTSRGQLRGLAVREGARRLALDGLTPAEANQLLGVQGVRAEQAALTELADLCDRLPLALAIAAERAGRRGGADALIAELRDERTRLDALDTADDPHTSMRTVLASSYSVLDEDTARMFRLLSLQPSPVFSEPVAAAVAGTDQVAARRMLDRLVVTHLLRQVGPDRYQLHDLVRAYAAELAVADGAGERDAGVRRALDWWTHTLQNAAEATGPSSNASLWQLPDPPVTPALHFGSLAAGVAWAETERDGLLAWVRVAERGGYDADVWRLGRLIARFLELGRHHDEGVALARLTVAAAQRLDDPVRRFLAVDGLGAALHSAHRYAEAREAFVEGVTVARDEGDRIAEAVVLSNLAAASLNDGAVPAAIAYLEDGLALASGPAGRADGTLGLRYKRQDMLVNLGAAYFMAGDQPTAIKHTEDALHESRRAGDWYREVQSLGNLAEEYEAHGDLVNAETYCDQALERLAGMPAAETELDVLVVKGRVLAATGRPAAAYEIWSRALAGLPPDGDARRAQLEGLIADLPDAPIALVRRPS